MADLTRPGRNRRRQPRAMVVSRPGSGHSHQPVVTSRNEGLCADGRADVYAGAGIIIPGYAVTTLDPTLHHLIDWFNTRFPKVQLYLVAVQRRPL
jgi:hypothetical protein